MILKYFYFSNLLKYTMIIEPKKNINKIQFIQYKKYLTFCCLRQLFSNNMNVIDFKNKKIKIYIFKLYELHFF